MPQALYDGDFTQAQIAGPPEFETPFAADPTPYIYSLRYWQFLNNFTEPALGDPGPLGGIYAGGSSGTFKSVGGGVIEFSRTYVLVPNSRNEWETYVYAYHLPFTSWGFPATCVETVSLRVNSRIQYDYYATDDPDSIELPRAPQILSTCIGNVFLGDYFELIDPATPTGTEILAEDASFRIWKPGIYERRMRFIKWISGIDIITGVA
jgi:hypothetical protein